METALFGLSWLVVAMAIQRAFLAGRSRTLRAKEQAYRFHALRDELQLMAAEGRVETTSLTYNFLMQSLNLGTRNAGLMKLREILELSEKVRRTVEETHFEAIYSDIQKHESSVRDLAGRIFFMFANILIANDWLVSAGLSTRRKILTSWGLIRPVVRLADIFATRILAVFAPTKVQAVDQARLYRNWAERLGTC